MERGIWHNIVKGHYWTNKIISFLHFNKLIYHIIIPKYTCIFFLGNCNGKKEEKSESNKQ